MAIEYDDNAAELMEAMYMGHDVVAQRQAVLDHLAIQPGEHVIDIGAGPGFLATAIAEQTGSTGRVVGVDIAPAMVRRATDRIRHPWLSYAQGDATALPVEDAAFDVAVSTQVAEYMTDPAPYCAEFARVLKPGGRGLILSTDWQGVIWHSEHPDRMERVLRASDDSVVQSKLPRTLAPYLRNAGLVPERATAFPVVNLDLAPGNFSTGFIDIVRDFLGSQGNIDPAELASWEQELRDLSDRGAYFFSVNRFIFLIRRPA